MPTVAVQDITVHRVVAVDGEVEIIEGVVIPQGNVVPVDDLASYQKSELKDKNSHFSSLVRDVSDALYQEQLDAANASATEASDAEEGRSRTKSRVKHVQGETPEASVVVDE